MNLKEKEMWFMDQHCMYARELTNTDKEKACTDFQRYKANYIIGDNIGRGHEYFVQKINLKTLKKCLEWSIDPFFNKLNKEN